MVLILVLLAAVSTVENTCEWVIIATVLLTVNVFIRRLADIILLLVIHVLIITKSSSGSMLSLVLKFVSHLLFWHST